MGMRRQRLTRSILLGFAVSAWCAALYIWSPGFLELVQLKAEDTLFLLRGPLPAASGAVTAVSIDEPSLDKVGRWPWPRGKLAELIRAVDAAKPRAILLDMGFFEPDERLDLITVLDIAQAARLGRDEDVERLVVRRHPDYLLAQALAEAKATVVLGFFFHMSARGQPALTPDQVRARREQVARFACKLVRYSDERALDSPVLTAQAPEPNQPVITAAARLGGFFNLIPDEDGTIRRLPLVMRCGGQMYPSLVLAGLAAYLNRPLPTLKVKPYGLDPIELDGRTIPLDPRGFLRVNFRGGEKAVQVIEAVDLLEGRAPPQALVGKAALINVSALGVFDRRPTPFDRQLPGAYIHAQALDNILTGDYLVQTPLSSLLDLAAVLALGLGAALLLALPKAGWGLGLVAAAGAGYFVLAWRLFAHGVVISLVYPLIALVAAGVSMMVYRYLVEEREKRRVRHAFQHYLSPEVIAQLLDSPGGLSVGGVKRELSVLFVDIRGFTSISERLDPEVLAGLLNEFMTRMTRVIMRRGGLVDKFIGDAVMAVYGAPLPQPDHAARACLTALDVLAEAGRLDESWRAAGAGELRIGVGINSGPMVVGNMGSELRFDYTVIGDNVNLASRLEGLTRHYGVDIVVSDATRAQCAEQFHFRVLDAVRAKGRREPVVIYQLLGRAEGPEPALAGLCERIFRAYQGGEYSRALILLDEALSLAPGDRALKDLAERCAAGQDHPSPEQDPEPASS